MKNPITAFYARAVTLLLLFWLTLLLYNYMLPPLEGTDEVRHFGYLHYLWQNGHIPPLETDDPLVQQESGQAPLYYLLIYGWSQLERSYDWQVWDSHLPENPWANISVPAFSTENINKYLLGRKQIPYTAVPGIERANQWVRYPSLLLGLITLSLGLSAARRLFPPQWALFAAISFGFTSTLIYVFTYTTNDALSIMLGTATIYGLVRLMMSPISKRLVLIIGTVIGIGMLSKASIIIYLPSFMLAIGLRTYPQLRRSFRYLVLGSIPIVGIGAPWYIYMALRYGDPIGIAPHLEQKWAKNEFSSLIEAFRQLFDRNALSLRSFWGTLTESFIDAGDWIYLLPLLVIALAIIGYIRGFHRIRHRFGSVILVLGLAYISILSAFIRWMTYFDFLSARLTFPAHLAIVLLITIGLYGGYRHSFMWGRIVISTGVIFIALFLSGVLTYTRIFGVITFTPDQVPQLQGTPLQYGSVELLGYTISPHTINSEDAPQMTLCWRSLEQIEMLEVPHIVAVNIVGEADTRYYHHESYSGLGMYTYWQANRAFCDRFVLQEENLIENAQAYRVIVDLLDPNTYVPIASSAENTVIGWMVVSGEPYQSEPLVDFSEIYLLDYTLTIIDDGSLEIRMEWGTGAWQSRPVTLFVHVMIGDRLYSQLDNPLGASKYPTVLWGQNERTLTNTYSVDIPNEPYQIFIGLYESNTGERLAISSGNLTASSDNRFLLETNNAD